MADFIELKNVNLLDTRHSLASGVGQASVKLIYGTTGLAELLHPMDLCNNKGKIYVGSSET